MKTSYLLLRLTFAGLTLWAPLAVAQAPPTLGIQLDGGRIGINITGLVGTAYTVQTTTNLVQTNQWQAAGIVKLPSRPFTWVDTNTATSTRRFYRTLEGPTNLVWIPPGTFTMGSPASEAQRDSDETQHQVTLTKGFWMGKYEVTQGEYLEVVGSNPSFFRNGIVPQFDGNGGAVTNELRHPVEEVSSTDATNYCAKLTAWELGAGRIPVGWRYRLPTEAEWEYASRGGTAHAFHYGAALRQGMANFNIHYEYDSTTGTITTTETLLGRTSEVGSYAPNAYGLYDMHGNVFEWCSDWYGPYPGTVTDPVGATEEGLRVLRGGCWFYRGRSCRSAFRIISDPDFRNNWRGFRVVLSPGQ